MKTSDGLMGSIAASLRDMGYTPKKAAAATRRHLDLVRYFYDDKVWGGAAPSETADEVANIIDQHERGGLEVAAEGVETNAQSSR